MKTKIFNTILFSLMTLTSVFAQKAGSLSMSVSMTNPTCNRYYDGTITVNPIGGVSPYTYIWSNGDTTQTISNLLAGNYSVSVIDANNQTSAAFITLTDPAPIQIQSVSTNVTSYLGSDGSIDIIDVLNTVGSYTFTWVSQNGSPINPTSLDQTNLKSDNYKIIVTDQNGCSGIAYYQITQPFPTLNPINLPKPGKFGNNPSAISIFPNPSNGNITVDFKSNVDEYRLVNVNTGSEVLTGKPNGEKLNVNNLPTGTYILYIQNGDETQLERITIL